MPVNLAQLDTRKMLNQKFNQSNSKTVILGKSQKIKSLFYSWLEFENMVGA